MIIGENIMFKRSNGEWCDGKIKDIMNDYCIVEWYTSDCKIGTKTVLKPNIKIKINRRFTFAQVLLIFVITLVFMKIILMQVVNNLFYFLKISNMLLIS
jgi:hypothetical protein